MVGRGGRVAPPTLVMIYYYYYYYYHYFRNVYYYNYYTGAYNDNIVTILCTVIMQMRYINCAQPLFAIPVSFAVH